MLQTFVNAVDSTTVDPFSIWFTALGGAAIAVAGGLVGAWIQGRREHKMWLRQKRFDLYNGLLEAAAVAHFDKSIGREVEFKLGLTKTTAAVANTLLAGPTSVHDLASNMAGSLVKFDVDDKQSLDYYTTRGLFVLEARAVLGIEADRDEKKRRAAERRSPTPPVGSGGALNRSEMVS